MLNDNRLQIFADGAQTPDASAAAGVSVPADAGQDPGEKTIPADAGQEESGRRPYEEIRRLYRAEFDAELQDTLRRRLRRERERTERLLAEKDGPAPQGPLPAALGRAREARAHLDALSAQARALEEKLPGFSLLRELGDPAFAELTRPGSPVTVEQACYALHPELRRAETERAARAAAEAVAASVRDGQYRPAENGAGGPAPERPAYRDMAPDEREALKRRIRAAGYEGRHVPLGG